jgi:hypothetical protein
MRFEKPYLEILLFDEEEILTASANTDAKTVAGETILGTETGKANAAVSVDINRLTPQSN